MAALKADPWGVHLVAPRAGCSAGRSEMRWAVCSVVQTAGPTVEWWAKMWADLKVVSSALSMAASTVAPKAGLTGHCWAAKWVATMAATTVVSMGLHLAVTTAGSLVFHSEPMMAEM